MIALNTYVCVWSVAQYMSTYIFWGAAAAIFFAVCRHKKLRRFGRIAHVNTYPLPRLSLPLTLPPAVATRRDLLLQLYCAGNAFCALHFIAASICFCKQTPLLPRCPLYLPTQRPTTPVLTDCREV